VEQIVRRNSAAAQFDVASNPEFLREGSAIEDFLRPDRVVVGCDSEHARQVLREVYRPLYLNETPILFTTRETAELIKYAANAFLATKITFINEMADLCERLGGDVQDVARGIGLDGRIGSKFLHAGPGYGGSCFPKDTLALLRTSQEAGAPTRIVETVVAVNEARKKEMAHKISRAFGGVSGKTIAIFGLTFKPNTDDMREAPALTLIEDLLAAGATVAAHDPVAMDEARRRLSKVGDRVRFAVSSYEALEGADALAVVTDWNEYRHPDFGRIKQTLKRPLIVDGRNLYALHRMADMGFTYHSVGRPTVA
jgi:UDPglucose 6-dehydrogenase